MKDILKSVKSSIPFSSTKDISDCLLKDINVSDKAQKGDNESQAIANYLIFLNVVLKSIKKLLRILTKDTSFESVDVIMQNEYRFKKFLKKSLISFNPHRTMTACEIQTNNSKLY